MLIALGVTQAAAPGKKGQPSCFPITPRPRPAAVPQLIGQRRFLSGLPHEPVDGARMAL
jgi:hypothetical protein